ncbi:hypothetical protein PNOK_0856700 [Pyrrhoderma noxium]|uniref:Secreted protein n=1 Tax=Pyrrhoderma noxium TaxID=2282107 RepID=A0A286U851_9AGAM|nr:hypothetical protein PNOK_0856700 [Pyrrhoderma noxium]
MTSIVKISLFLFSTYICDTGLEREGRRRSTLSFGTRRTASVSRITVMFQTKLSSCSLACGGSIAILSRTCEFIMSL